MEPVSLNDNLPFLLGDINHRIYQKVSRLFRENNFGVTLEQFSVLTILWYEDGLKQQEIALRLNRDKTTITRIINNMIRENLVIKVPDKTDQRVTLVYLTHYGRQSQEKMVRVTGNIYMQLMNGLEKSEIDRLIKYLNKIKSNLI